MITHPIAIRQPLTPLCLSATVTEPAVCDRPSVIVDDVYVFDRLVTSTWSGTPVSRPKSTVAIVLYIAAGLGGALLALFGGGGIARVVWSLFAVVFVVLGITLAVYHSRRN